MNEQRCSFTSRPESAPTTLFVYFPAGICANNAVRSLPGRNLHEQRCSLTTRPEFAPTTLFAHYPAGICANNAVRSLPGRNLHEQYCSFTSRLEFALTVLFAHLPTGICASNVVCSIAGKNHRKPELTMPTVLACRWFSLTPQNLFILHPKLAAAPTTHPTTRTYWWLVDPRQAQAHLLLRRP